MFASFAILSFVCFERSGCFVALLIRVSSPLEDEALNLYNDLRNRGHLKLLKGFIATQLKELASVKVGRPIKRSPSNSPSQVPARKAAKSDAGSAASIKSDRHQIAASVAPSVAHSRGSKRSGGSRGRGSR